MPDQIRKFMAISTVNGPNLWGTLRTAISFPGPLTEQVWDQIEQAIRSNARGTQVPPGATVTLVNLIPLEG